MPGLNYFKNHAGLSLSDDEMKDIPLPQAEMITHVTIKDVQGFGLLGSLLFGPLYALTTKQNRNLYGITRLSGKFGTRGAALGLLAGPAMAIGRMQSLSEDEVRDRCYRLRCNRNQVRVDQASIVGLAGGGVIARLVVGTGTLQGAVLGMSAGVIAAAAFNHQKGDKTT